MKIMKRGPEKTILWAIDPFESNRETHSTMAGLLGKLISKQPFLIEPIYVDQGIPKKILELALKKAMKSSIRPLFSPLLLKSIKKEKVITHLDSSIRAQVQALLEYAEKSNSALIAVGTNSRSGLQRLVLGSFAETLALYSKIPLLVARPKAKIQSISRILFPSELTSEDRASWRNLLEFAKAIGAKVTLLYVVPRMVETLIDQSVLLLGGGWVNSSHYIQRNLESKQAMAQDFREDARKEKMKVDLIFDSSSSSVSGSILRHATNLKVDLLAMTAKKSAVTSVLIGSVTRKILRSSTCPVWIMRI